MEYSEGRPPPLKEHKLDKGWSRRKTRRRRRGRKLETPIKCKHRRWEDFSECDHATQ